MKILNKKAFSIIEYTVLLVIIIAAFLVMRNYIQRGVFGNWGKSGQSFGYGRQYDPQNTIECGFDEQSNLWYDENCFKTMINKNKCNGDASCEEGVMNKACQTDSCSAATNSLAQ